MAEIVLRPLSLGDRTDWADLRHALWPDQARRALEEELEGMLIEGMVGFGAFDDGQLLGFAEASQRAYGDGCDTSPVAWLEAIYVRAPWRRHGLARQLLSAVEAWARQRGLSELGSDADLGNLISRLSHARWGFEETERIVCFRKVL